MNSRVRRFFNSNAGKGMAAQGRRRCIAKDDPSAVVQHIPSYAALDRRDFLERAAAGGLLAAFGLALPAYAQPSSGRTRDTEDRQPGEPIDLYVRRADFSPGTGSGKAITINGTVPGPLLRLRQGEDVVIRVHNELDEDTSIHWHGLILPYEMDGVPGVSYPGIKSGSTFTYSFPVRQSGTYWYHSHTGLQEQLGHYGPLIIDSEGPEAADYDREHIIVLSDWTFEDPHDVLATLKKLASYYNYQERTASEFLRDAASNGLAATVSDRVAWGRMRMSPTDIADITGFTYTYLINGRDPGSNWTGHFIPGERVRLRFINAATMSYFNVRIPGLPMTVVQADGQDVVPVETDEIQIGVAETYDVVVTTPQEDQAYTIFAEAMDRSGFARATLAPRPDMTAPVPALRERPLRTMTDMGMDMDMSSMGGMQMDAEAPTHAGHGAGMQDAMGPGIAADSMDSMVTGGSTEQRAPQAAAMTGIAGNRESGSCVPGMTPCTSPVVGRHGTADHGTGNTTVASVQRNRLGEPGTGLAQVGHRVLVYTDLRRTADDYDARSVDRELELHLTGNMERYMWSFDGRKYSEVKGAIEFNHGERLRLILVNDTMMEHPIHLHGMWMELENGHGSRIPRKHTISVKPAERLSALITVDAPGRWAFHCHLLFHMDMGMFRVVHVA